MLIFALVYAVILSFGIECLFQCIGIPATSVLGAHSQYVYWFSFVAGIFATVTLIAIFILNLNLSDKLGYNKYVWWIQMTLGVILAFFFVEPWQTLFERLREIL